MSSLVLQSRPVMGQGMLADFVVMALLALCITLLNWFGNPTKKNAKG